MNNELMIFEGQEIEILTKEDVTFDFDGAILFNGKQVCTILEYVDPSSIISRNVRDNHKYKVVNSVLLNQQFRKLNNAGETFITDKGVMKLIINSKMPKADEFEDKVWEIISKVQQTGSYDSIEEDIKMIEDETERNLSLELYSMQKSFKINKDNISLSILVAQKTMELQAYKHQQQLDKVSQEQELIKTEMKDFKDTIINQQTFVCDRTSVNEKIKILANKYFGRDIQLAYKNVYQQMKILGSFDVYRRLENEKKIMQNERLLSGKTPYAQSTLNQKLNCLDIIDKNDKWILFSEAYKYVEMENLK